MGVRNREYLLRIADPIINQEAIQSGGKRCHGFVNSWPEIESTGMSFRLSICRHWNRISCWRTYRTEDRREQDRISFDWVCELTIGEVVIDIFVGSVLQRRSMVILLTKWHLRIQIMTGLVWKTEQIFRAWPIIPGRQGITYITFSERWICPDDCEPVQADMNHSGIVIEWNRMNMWRGNQTRQFYWMTSECADGALRG